MTYNTSFKVQVSELYKIRKRLLQLQLQFRRRVGNIVLVRKHKRLLPQRTTRLFDANFVYRALLFILTLLTLCKTILNVVLLRSVHILINKRMCVYVCVCVCVCVVCLQSSA